MIRVNDDPEFVARMQFADVLPGLLSSQEMVSRWEKTGKVGEHEVGLLGIKESRACSVHPLP